MADCENNREFFNLKNVFFWHHTPVQVLSVMLRREL